MALVPNQRVVNFSQKMNWCHYFQVPVVIIPLFLNVLPIKSHNNTQQNTKLVQHIKPIITISNSLNSMILIIIIPVNKKE